MFHNKLLQYAIFIISLGLCLSATGTIIDLWHRKDLLTTRQNDLNRILSENRKLSQQLRDSQTDSYVERIARDKLGLVKDGEAIILLPPSSKEGSTRTSDDAKKPNWQKWWSLFF